MTYKSPDLFYSRCDGKKIEVCTFADGKLQQVEISASHALQEAENLIRAARHVSLDRD